MQPEYGIQNIVRRQVIFILLIMTKLRRRRFVNYGLRNYRLASCLYRTFVYPAAKGKNIDFENISDGPQSADSITVEGEVAHCNLAPVACIKKHGVEFV